MSHRRGPARPGGRAHRIPPTRQSVASTQPVRVHPPPRPFPQARARRPARRRYEARFIAAQSQTHRHEILGGLAVHAAAVLLQWHAVFRPEYVYDYAAAGSPGLAADIGRAQLILGLHLLVTVACCATLARDMFRDPRCAATSRRRVLMLKVATCRPRLRVVCPAPTSIHRSPNVLSFFFLSRFPSLFFFSSSSSPFPFC